VIDNSTYLKLKTYETKLLEDRYLKRRQ